MYLGRIDLVKRVQPGKTGSRDCRVRTCQEEIKVGELHILLRRTSRSKVNGQTYWSTKRFHLKCFYPWLQYMEEWLASQPKKTRKSRSTYIKLRPDITAEEVVERRALQQRKSYVLGRLRQTLPNETRDKLRQELITIEDRLHSFGDYNEKWAITKVTSDGNIQLMNKWDMSI